MTYKNKRFKALKNLVLNFKGKRSSGGRVIKKGEEIDGSEFDKLGKSPEGIQIMIKNCFEKLRGRGRRDLEDEVKGRNKNIKEPKITDSEEINDNENVEEEDILNEE